MATIEEFEHLLAMDGTGIIVYKDGAGMEERIREWLNTPQGTIADKPGWGHNLATLKHEPFGPTLNVMAEMLIIEKLPLDIMDISIIGVSVEFIDIARCYIRIDTTTGSFTQNFTFEPNVGSGGSGIPSGIPGNITLLPITLAGALVTFGGEETTW